MAFNLSISLRLACQLFAAFYQIYSIISFIFYLCTFASPNFIVLVNLGVLSNQTNRFMYVVAQTSFWTTYLWCATVLHLAINWEWPELSWPFCCWCVVNVIWEIILIACEIAYFEDVRTIGIIFWKIFNITIAGIAVTMFYYFFKSESENDVPENTKEGDEPTDLPLPAEKDPSEIPLEISS